MSVVLKQPIVDLLTKLRTLSVTNPDQTTTTPHVRVWNNQLDYEKEGQLQNYPKPAFFLEVVSPAVFSVLGEGYRSCDINFRVHIVHEYMNSDGVEAGNFEQDLAIFDLRDQVIELLTRHTPPGCGPMECMQESPDYAHDNLYHYVLDFITNFTDGAGRKRYVMKEPPTALELTVATENQNQTVLLQPFNLQAYSTSYKSTADGTVTFLVLDAAGNMIVGANIVSVQIEIKPLEGPNKWTWNANTSTITLLAGEQVDDGQTAFITYQQRIPTAN